MQNLTTLAKSAYRFFSEMDREQLRDSARERADQMLEGYGYRRGPSPMMQVITHVATFGAGVAVGAGVGVLLAPRSGAETREQIATKGAEARERIAEVTDEQLGKIGDAFESIAPDRYETGADSGMNGSASTKPGEERVHA